MESILWSMTVCWWSMHACTRSYALAWQFMSNVKVTFFSLCVYSWLLLSIAEWNLWVRLKPTRPSIIHAGMCTCAKGEAGKCRFGTPQTWRNGLARPDITFTWQIWDKHTWPRDYVSIMQVHEKWPLSWVQNVTSCLIVSCFFARHEGSGPAKLYVTSDLKTRKYGLMTMSVGHQKGLCFTSGPHRNSYGRWLCTGREFSCLMTAFHHMEEAWN